MRAETLEERWRREDEAQIDSAIDALLQHGHGRRLLWWLLQIGRVGGQPYTGNALNTAFSCGELNVGQKILDRIISVSPEGYLTMMKEQADERTNRTGALNGTARGADPEPRTYDADE